MGISTNSLNFIYVSKSNLDSIPIVNGQVIVISTSNINEMYIDINNSRHRFINDEYTFICNGEDDSTRLSELINQKLVDSDNFNLRLNIVGNFKLVDTPQYSCEIGTGEDVVCYVPIISASNLQRVSNIELDFSNANIIEPISSTHINGKNVLMFYLDADVNFTIKNLHLNKTNPLIGSLIYSKQSGTLNIIDSNIYCNMIYDVPYSCITNETSDESICVNLNNCEFYLNEFTDLVNCQSNCNLNNCYIYLQKLHQYNGGNIKNCTLNSCSIFIDFNEYISNNTSGILSNVDLYNSTIKVYGNLNVENIQTLQIVVSEYIENTVIDCDIQDILQDATIPLRLVNFSDGTIINSTFNINQNNIIPYDVKFNGEVLYSDVTNMITSDILNNTIKVTEGMIGLHILGNPSSVKIVGNNIIHRSYNGSPYTSTAIDVNPIKYIFDNNVISKYSDVIIDGNLIEELSYNNIRLDI